MQRNVSGRLGHNMEAYCCQVRKGYFNITKKYKCYLTVYKRENVSNKGKLLLLSVVVKCSYMNQKSNKIQILI